ncbi:hypothetical protein GCM10010313_49620 [Streptomyces violarus]|nr:hypothetical protein GCM10010313_49620 [Streptomyces violarus]
MRVAASGLSTPVTSALKTVRGVRLIGLTPAQSSGTVQGRPGSDAGRVALRRMDRSVAVVAPVGTGGAGARGGGLRRTDGPSRESQAPPCRSPGGVRTGRGFTAAVWLRRRRCFALPCGGG